MGMCESFLFSTDKGAHADPWYAVSSVSSYTLLSPALRYLDVYLVGHRPIRVYTKKSR